MKIENIYPASIQIKHDYIKIDNLFVSSIIITELAKEIDILEINKMIPANLENIVSIEIKKVELSKEIRRLTKIITETNSDLKSINISQQDIDIVSKINKEALDLRKKIQVENEEIYSINIYISISDMSQERLKINVSKLISNLYTNGIMSRIANFRHEEVYLSTLPLNNSIHLNNQTNINVTTSQLSYLIPFVIDYVYDKKGIVFGFMKNAVCIYDLFSKENMNHNMCILGSSGAGKSFFVKTLILRNFCMNVPQIVFDIEGEYVDIARKTNTMVFDDTNFNLMYIPEIFVKSSPSNYFDSKVECVFKGLNNLLNGKLAKYEDICKKEIMDVYREIGITENVQSLYNYNSINKKYMSYSSFPNQKELIKRFEKNTKIPKGIKEELAKNHLIKNYDESMVKKLDNQQDTIIVFNFNKLSTNCFDTCLDFTEQFYSNKLLIYIDEMWKYIKDSREKKHDNRIAELFKTIRKKRAGIVIISQDIHDMFSYKNGDFGKSILNNSYTKLFFKMQYMDSDLLKELGIYSDDTITRIRRLTRGVALMNIGDIKFDINVKSSDYEKSIIEGEELHEKNTSSN